LLSRTRTCKRCLPLIDLSNAENDKRAGRRPRARL
jgi:hypothetical protein